MRYYYKDLYSLSLKTLQKEVKTYKINLQKSDNINISEFLGAYNDAVPLNDFLQFIGTELQKRQVSFTQAYVSIQSDGEYSSYYESLIISYSRDKTREELIKDITKKYKYYQKREKLINAMRKDIKTLHKITGKSS